MRAPDRDVFEDAGAAVNRPDGSGDGLPLPVLTFSEVIVDCLRTAHKKSCIDNEFIKEICSTSACTTVTHILVDC